MLKTGARFAGFSLGGVLTGPVSFELASEGLPLHSPRIQVILVTLAVCLLAAGARFARLGAWSFAADEVASLQEADALLDSRPVTDDPITRLPRMTPLGVAAHGLTYRELGRTEFAARLPAAVAGVLLCGLTVVGLWTTLGGWGATATALLVALNPEFVFYGQYNRYYSIGSLLAGGCILAGLAAVRRGTTGWILLASILAAAAMADHLLLAGLFPGLVAAALLAPEPSWRDRARLAAVVAIVGSVVAAVGVLYVAPLAQGWNRGVGWGYSLPRALAGGVNQLGAPTALLAGLGAVLMLLWRHPFRWFWAVWAAGWLASLVVLPRVLAFHPGYSFLYLFGPIVLAGYAVGQVAEKLAASGPGFVRGAIPAATWVGVAALLNAPALASHYADGSRYDFRAAAQFVAKHRQPGEAVATVSPGNFAFYEPVFADAIPLNSDRLIDGFREVSTANRPCWVVVVGGRGPRNSEAQDWLNTHCRLKTTIRKSRFDYYDFTVEVYFFEPGKGS